jgi:hypothetical protein
MCSREKPASTGNRTPIPRFSSPWPSHYTDWPIPRRNVWKNSIKFVDRRGWVYTRKCGLTCIFVRRSSISLILHDFQTWLYFSQAAHLTRTETWLHTQTSRTSTTTIWSIPRDSQRNEINDQKKKKGFYGCSLSYL